MPQFEMPQGKGAQWASLDEFARGYVEAMWFTNSGESDDALTGLDVDALAPETLERIASDCAAFMAKFPNGFGHADDAQAGRDFWFNRCGHGVGFWDRPALYGVNLARLLDEAAREAGNLDPYVGDDGRVYLM